MVATNWFEDTGEPAAQKCARQVRWRAGGKGLHPQYLACGLSDWLPGFSGPKAEAEQIKQKLRKFLRETLKLELSEQKTLITHARTSAAKFLGYYIVSQHADDKLDRRGQRQVNEMVSLRVPREVIEQKCALYMKRGKPAQRAQVLDDSDYSIGSPVSSGVSGKCPILSSRPKCGPVQQIKMGGRNILTQDAGRQAQGNSHRNGAEIQSHDRNRSRSEKMPSGSGRSRKEQEALSRSIWRYPSHTQARRDPGRPHASISHDEPK
jgi:hypothetical protein